MRFIQLLIVSFCVMSTFVLAEDIDEEYLAGRDYRKICKESPTFNAFFQEPLLMLEEAQKESYKNAKHISEVEARQRKYLEALPIECEDGDNKKCLIINFLFNTNILKDENIGISSEVLYHCSERGEEYIKQLCLKDKNGNACFVYARGAGETKDYLESLKDDEYKALEKLDALLKGEEYEECTSLAKEFYKKGCEYGNEESCISTIKYLSLPKERLEAMDRYCMKGNMLSFCQPLGKCFSKFGGTQNGDKFCAALGQQFPDPQKAIKYLEKASNLGTSEDKSLFARELLAIGECKKGIVILKNLCENEDNGFACFTLATAYYKNFFPCFPADNKKEAYYNRKACNAGYQVACEILK